MLSKGRTSRAQPAGEWPPQLALGGRQAMQPASPGGHEAGCEGAEPAAPAAAVWPGPADDAAQIFCNILPSGGVAVWWEDWSAVGYFLQELAESGVEPDSYFAKHPEIFEALHAQVTITDVNDLTMQMMGATDKSQLIGPISAILPNTIFSFQRWVLAIAHGEAHYRGQNAIRRLDGSSRECLIAAVLSRDPEQLRRLAVLVVDISEYRGGPNPTVQSTIEHAARVAAMGTLTASIAHEVKNPLAAIVVNAGACRRWLRLPVPDLAEAEEAIANVMNDATRAREVVDRTLSFLKPTNSKAVALDISAVVRDAILLTMWDLQRYDVAVEFLPEGQLPAVFADMIQVQQVLINLILNAVQAMLGVKRGRKITIRVREAGLDIMVEVADIGTGIAPEQIERIFEPFYSTKGSGIGMGLAVSRSCVEANGGRIWVASVLGTGTRFYFTLPVCVSN